MILTGSPDQKATRLDFTFSKLLLKHAVHHLVLEQFAEKSDLPQHKGATTIRFFRRKDISSANDVQELAEGTPIDKFSSTKLETLDVTLREFGDACKLSNTRVETDLYSQLEIEVKRMGESAALHFDQLIRDELINGTNLLITQKMYGSGKSNFGELSGKDRPVLTFNDIMRARTRLKINLAPKYDGGEYVLVVSSEGAHDLLQDPNWLRVREYQDKKPIYRGELGTHMGVRIVECSNPFREGNDEGKYVADGPVFSAFLLGREAFAAPKLEGSNSPLVPKMIYNDKPDKSDPLNSYITAGWKGMYAAKVLNPKHIVVIRHKSSFA